MTGSKITKEQIKEAVDYVFKSNGNKITKDNSLSITQTEDYHHYKIGDTLIVGFTGFKNLIEKVYCNRDFYPIYFNGQELTDESIKQFWEQFDNFKKD